MPDFDKLDFLAALADIIDAGIEATGNPNFRAGLSGDAVCLNRLSISSVKCRVIITLEDIEEV